MYSTESDLIMKPSSERSQKDVNLVEQILEQGQRLRNSMVKAILDHDPFLQDSNQTDDLESSIKGSEVTLEEKHKFLAYLRGEHMTRNEEKKVLETFKAMSNVDIIDITDRSLYSDYSCNCDTCREYYKHNSSCDLNFNGLRRNKILKIPNLNLNEKNLKKENDLLDVFKWKCLKYIDSLKVIVYELHLNQEGIKKVYGNNSEGKYGNFPLSRSHSYFLEYKIPFIISKNCNKSKSKVDSGLDSGNFVRMCSKKVHGEAIIFKQISLHDIQNIENVNLQTIDIKFQVSSRTYRQKTTNILGLAKFNMKSLLEGDDLTSTEDLLIVQSVGAPIVVGKVKIGLEFGCGQSYFGDNFLRVIRSSKEEENLGESKHVNTEIFSEDEEIVKEGEKKTEGVSPKMIKPGIEINKDVFEEEMKIVKKPMTKIEKIDYKNIGKEKEIKEINEVKVVTMKEHENIPPFIHNEQILFGFFCVAEAHFQEVVDTFVSCNPFCRNDTLYSHLVLQNQTPLYNFQQCLPFVYDESFLNSLRDNFMVFEFWRKSQPDEAIGICKINLHQFYISYRNTTISKYLERNKLPVIGCDWWEPIYDPLTGEIHGEAQILLALGTEVQIHNLKTERGFVNEIVKVKSGQNINNELNKQNVVVKEKEVVKKLDEKKIPLKSNKNKPKLININKKYTKTKEIGTQSDFKMNEGTKIDKESNDEPKQSENFTAIASFLQNLMKSGNKTFMETCTNTDQTPRTSSYPTIGKTSDLLDTLQESLALPQENLMSQQENLASQEYLALRQENLTSRQENLSSQQEYLSSRQENLSLRQENLSLQDNLPLRQENLSLRQDNLTLREENLTLREETSTLSKQKLTTFKAHIFIENALHLPFRKKSKTKKSRGKTGKYEEILPSTYVSFETTGNNVRLTNVVQKSKNPVWNYNCDVELPVELLINNEKRLIFKVWKRSNGMTHPDMDSDMVIGFAGLDLTILTLGMPNISGWFNILDFSSKCNGQIKITVTPKENLKGKYNYKKSQKPEIPFNNSPININKEEIEEPGELLSRALKRKFTELDEITQRLRLRLSHVTNDESDASNDELADEFERDINTVCKEDVEMDDFNKLTESFHLKSLEGSLKSDSKSNIDDLELGNRFREAIDPLDRHLVESRLKLDTLFEKLALLTNNDQVFNSRHISGCSVSQENKEESKDDSCSSGISVKSCIETRRAPEGAGNK